MSGLWMMIVIHRTQVPSSEVHEVGSYDIEMGAVVVPVYVLEHK